MIGMFSQFSNLNSIKKIVVENSPRAPLPVRREAFFVRVAKKIDARRFTAKKNVFYSVVFRGFYSVALVL
jgi:hypothetical protein